MNLTFIRHSFDKLPNISDPQSMVFLREIDMGEASAFYKRDRKAPDSHTHIQNRSGTGLL